MIIHVYSAMWNQEFLLPYYLRHYGQYAHRIVLYDNGSTDNSIAIAKAYGAEVRDWDTDGKFDEVALQTLKNNCWKESRGIADWVIVCDIDEFVYHKDLINHLAECQSMHEVGAYRTLKSKGYQLVSDSPPTSEGQLYDEIFLGCRDNVWMDKCNVFSPKLREINYSIGAHSAHSLGGGSWQHELKLLHAKFLGFEYVKDLHQRLSGRVLPGAVDRGWSTYRESDDWIRERIAYAWDHAELVIDSTDSEIGRLL